MKATLRRRFPSCRYPGQGQGTGSGRHPCLWPVQKRRGWRAFAHHDVGIPVLDGSIFSAAGIAAPIGVTLTDPVVVDHPGAQPVITAMRNVTPTRSLATGNRASAAGKRPLSGVSRARSRIAFVSPAARKSVSNSNGLA
jgi:hypothetical protein